MPISQGKPQPRRARRSEAKRRRARRGYSRKRRGVKARQSKLLISIITVPVYPEDAFWFRH
jgi:hypothetical protein